MPAQWLRPQLRCLAGLAQVSLSNGAGSRPWMVVPPRCQVNGSARAPLPLPRKQSRLDASADRSGQTRNTHHYYSQLGYYMMLYYFRFCDRKRLDDRSKVVES